MHASPRLRWCVSASLGALSLVAGAASADDAIGPYENFKWVTVQIDSPESLLAVSQLGESLACQAGPGPVDFVIEPDAMEALEALGVPYVLRSNNIQHEIDEETRANELARAERGQDFFATYRTIGEIWTYLDTLAALDTVPNPPGHIIEKFNTGDSVQGRNIYGLRIATPTPLGAPPKPVFLISATQHAREWAAGSSAMWIADRLCREYGIDPVVTQLLDNVDFHIIPIVNPDGYNHTFPTAQGGGNTRLWRKNRRLNSGGSFGVDLNRNWSVGWGLNGGSSTSQTSDTYRGTAAFSEPEAAAVSDYALTLSPLKAHIDIHTYSQLVLGPWGYTTTAPPRTSELNPLAAAMVSAIESVNGTNWTGGQASTTLYVASGVAPDWTFQTMNALSWTFELRDTGTFGFTLPASQIVPAATEAWAGIVALAQHIQVRLRLNLSGPPSSLALSTPANFGVSITTENQYTLQADSANLMWREGDSGAYNEVPLTGGPTNFTATLPAFGCGRTINYFVQATANDGLIVRTPTSNDLSASTPACPGCLGDANGDMNIDFKDITTILSHWGMSGAAPFDGDADYNGVVDFQDITIALGAWGGGCG
jgi:murein tripeptide amidase MpaA